VRTAAFAARIPHRDLLLSPDHAVFIDGVLIPIRYLINGCTIVQEPVNDVTYCHVELSSHDVILAEGLPCESYLDTGNRAAFANAGDEVMLHPDFALKVWKTKACAELLVDGPRVVAVKRRLLAEAAALGWRTIADPGLRVLADGSPLPAVIDGNMWRVRLSPAATSVRLVSRKFAPALMFRDNDDTRSLGVAIAQLSFDGRAVALNDPHLASGWHAPEPAWRWTDGDAVLTVTGAREMTFEVAITGTYWRVGGGVDGRLFGAATPSPIHRQG
jgi:hypothetical protein